MTFVYKEYEVTLKKLKKFSPVGKTLPREIWKFQRELPMTSPISFN